MAKCTQIYNLIISALNSIEVKGYENIKTLSNVIEAVTALKNDELKEEEGSEEPLTETIHLAGRSENKKEE